MAYQQSYQRPPQKKSSATWWIIGGCGAILVLAALCACGFFALGAVLPSDETSAPAISRATPVPPATTEAPAVAEVATVQPPPVPSEPTDTPQPSPPPTEAPTATIAPTDTPAPPPPTPTPSQPPLEILSSTSYVDDIGYFHIVGEVRNNGGQPMAFVKVVATLYDDADKVTGTDFTYTELDVIPPGGNSPFETGTDVWQGTTKYKLQVEGSPGPTSRQDVVILSHSSYVDDIGYFHVKGEVQNNGSDPATFVKIVVTLYDASKNVVGTDFTYTELDTLQPGSTSPFETGTDHWEGFDHYEIQVQAQ